MPQQNKVLCVDDEPQILSALTRALFEENYEVITSTSGPAALEVMAQAAPIQVVVSDFRMPGMDGVEFLQQVRAQWPDTVRIILSGYADTAAVVEAINEGQIYKFIPKPWNDDILKVTIAEALDLYALRQQTSSLARELAETRAELAALKASLAAR